MDFAQDELREVVKQIVRWAGAPDTSSFVDEVAPAPSSRKAGWLGMARDRQTKWHRNLLKLVA